MDDERELRRLRATLLRGFLVRPAIYWADLAVSATVTWAAILATMFARPTIAMVAFPVAVLAVLRATYFVHDISHSRRSLPGFELAWNLAIGIWVLLPSFMADPHVDHHAPTTYGPPLDPEYEPVAGWGRAHILGSISMMLVVPPLLVLRYGLIGPLAWFVPPLRRLVWARMSTLQTNTAYTRAAIGSRTVRAISAELAASAAVGALALALMSGRLPPRVALAWWAVTACALVVNQARTLVAHAYTSSGEPMSLAEQVADSATALGPPWLTGLVYPVGTQFHALHHLAPTLPYHALRAAHARACEIGAPAALRHTSHRGFARALAFAWSRAGSRATIRSHRRRYGSVR